MKKKKENYVPLKHSDLVRMAQLFPSKNDLDSKKNVEESSDKNDVKHDIEFEITFIKRPQKNH